MFDLRSLEHSTILYEAAPSPPVVVAGGPTTPATSSGSGGGGSSGHSSAGTATATTTTAGGKVGASGGAGQTSPLGGKKTGGGSSSASSSNNNNNSNAPPAPLLRLAFSPTSPNYLAVVHADSPHVQILDTRSPGTAAFEVRGHKAPVNGIAWGAGGTMSASGGSGPGWLSTVCESITDCVVFPSVGSLTPPGVGYVVYSRRRHPLDVGPLSRATARATNHHFFLFFLFCFAVNGGGSGSTATESDHDSGVGVYGSERSERRGLGRGRVDLDRVREVGEDFAVSRRGGGARGG